MSDHNSIHAPVSNQDQYHNYPKITPSSRITKRAMSVNQFKDRASKIHENKYDYSKVNNFMTLSQRVTIICPFHGEFTKSVSAHLKGGGCKQCAYAFRGQKKSQFLDACKDGMGRLYVILCIYNANLAHKTEVFYKIGITSQTIENRFRGDMPYDYEIVFEIINEASAIYDLEKMLHRALEKHSYKPNKSFGGETECFSTIEPILFLLDRLEGT